MGGVVAGWVLLASFAAAADGTGDPALARAQIQETSQKVIALFKDPDLIKPENRDALVNQLRAVLDERFDWPTIGRWVLATNRSLFSDAQTDEFAKLFADFAVLFYLTQIKQNVTGTDPALVDQIRIEYRDGKRRDDGSLVLEKEDLGVLTVEQATWKSSNTVYAALAKEVGPAKVAEMGKRLGITAPLAANYSLVLGTTEVSVLDMATVYSTFANRGVLRTPYMIKRIEDASGRVLFDGEAGRAGQQVIPREVADTVTSVLQGVLTKGTATGAAIRTLAAGKTGTTQDSKDAWFSGYTCHLTATVWMGFQQPKAMDSYKGRKVTGGSFPATIWRDFMNKATKGQSPCKYPAVNAGKNVLNQSLSAVTTVPGQSTTSSTSSTSSTSTVPGASSTTVVPTTARPVPTTARPPTTVPRPTTTVRPVPTTLAPG
jgi:hypothetical protein